MSNFAKPYYSEFFSHIYVEENAKEYELTKDILLKFKTSKIIEIKHYKDVFNRKNQYFPVQKKSPKLILAVNKEKFIYEGSTNCNSFGNENFFYTNQIMNCFFDCEYCYLAGMYPSANIVIFVNQEDMFFQIESVLKEKSLYICISYDSDLFAFENITGFIKKWLIFIEGKNNLKLEIRTKSNNFYLLSNTSVNENIVWAWTISPIEIIENYEKGTAGFYKRLENIKLACRQDRKVRICLDPLIFLDNWEIIYKNMIDTMFNILEADKILDVSVGTFRVPEKYLKKMILERPCSKILAYNFEKGGYCQKDKEYMTEFVKNHLIKYVDLEKIKVY